MLRYTLKRLLGMIPALLAASLLIFAVIDLPPGDCLSNQMAELKSRGETAGTERLEFLRHEFDLDRSFLERYAIWMGLWPGSRGFSGLLQGDWGWSFEFNKSVASVVGETLALTIIVNAATVLFIYALAFPIGVYAATRAYGWSDYGITLAGYLGLAVPNFLLALALLYYANAWFGTAIGGLMAPEYADQPWSLAKLGSILAHLIVPVIVIGLSGTATMIRRLRANLLDELHKPYVIAARAKGLRERDLLVKYPLRLSLAPFIADIGNLLPSLVSGSVIVSVVLSLPTIGPVLVDALRAQDHFLSGFILLFTAVLTMIGMLISDLILALVDPRVRLGETPRQ
ncbi:MAG: ABC transporter permease [Alphaproteobacteria bacterium]|nr:ABC transporter permease [Alphaproteobacteria bacterium]